LRRRAYAGCVGRVAFERDDATAPSRHRLLECSFNHRTISIVGNHGRERALAARYRVIDDAMRIGLRQEAQEINAASGDIRVGRKGDHGNAARPRHLRRCADRLREQRPDDDRGAFAQRLLRGELRALRRAAIVLDQELNIGVSEFGDRHFGCVPHRSRRSAGIARCGDRQHHRHPHCARGRNRRAGLHWHDRRPHNRRRLGGR
jgi:hypothetical protein